MKPVDVRRFASPDALRAWYEANHAHATELWLGVAKKNASVDVLRYADALDLALAFGWIDGFVGKLDDTHYALRFTPRKAKSNWSAVNVKRYGELQAAGRITPAGAAAFESRDLAVSEERPAELTGDYGKRLRARRRAATFFFAQPPGYQRQAAWYVLSARTEPTRQKRLDALIAASDRGERLALAGGAAKAARPASAEPPVTGALRPLARKQPATPPAPQPGRSTAQVPGGVRRRDDRR